MAMSYIHNALFLDRIIVCSIILGIVFFAKMRNENKGYSNTDGTKYMDQIWRNVYKRNSWTKDINLKHKK